MLKKIRRRATKVKKRLKALRLRLRRLKVARRLRAARTENLRRRYHEARRDGKKLKAAKLLRKARKSAALLAEIKNTQRVVRKREAQQERKLKYLREQRDRWLDKQDGVVSWRGVPVAAWMVPWLERSVKAGWSGNLLSGFRTPEYSEGLCYAICGAPSCPGRCAGRNSGHSQKVYPGGCIDVVYSEAAHFAAIQRRIGSPLHNAIGPSDPNHFSVSGR